MSDHVERGFSRDCFSDTAFMARAYGKSLRDNLFDVDVAAHPELADEVEHIRTRLEDELSRNRPSISRFFEIEIRLTQLADPELVKARYWAVDDRFQRVVPKASRERRDKALPPTTSACWSDPAWLRRQTISMLDVIHNNILTNLSREQSTLRLKIWLLVILGVLGGLVWWISARGSGENALLLLFSVGVVGGVVSIAQRLQKAVSHDAMTEDGAFEIISLRLGWMGVVMSALSGGIFALVLYAIVMGGLLNFLTPSPEAPVTAAEQVAAVQAGALTQAADALAQAAAAAPATGALNLVAPAPPVAPPETPGGPLQLPVFVPGTAEERVSAPGAAAATELGLKAPRDFFIMLVLAFLAGFAERLVPDMLDRLTKKVGARE